MLSLQRPQVHFLSFEITDIFKKMKLYSSGNLSNGQFVLSQFYYLGQIKFELFFLKSEDFKSSDGFKVFVKL